MRARMALVAAIVLLIAAGGTVVWLVRDVRSSSHRCAYHDCALADDEEAFYRSWDRKLRPLARTDCVAAECTAYALSVSGLLTPLKTAVQARPDVDRYATVLKQIDEVTLQVNTYLACLTNTCDANSIAETVGILDTYLGFVPNNTREGQKP
ncbi:MAG: hypothetical protein ACJ73S_16375 [Mycobacteriales bacterium]